jgi:hypothetical protein
VTVSAARPPSLPASIAADLDALSALVRDRSALPRNPTELAELLYHAWYLRIAPPESPMGAPAPAELDLGAALDAAHAGRLRLAPGWFADRVSSAGRVEAVHERRRRIANPGEYVDLDHVGRPPEPGDRLRVSPTFSSIEGGFWVSRSMSWQEGDVGPLARIYLNVRLAGAATAVALLTELLEDATTPYALKVSTELGAVQRADALVVYLPRGRFALLHAALGRVGAALQRLGHLVPANPRLTARLMPGVGAADGDRTGSSFGQDRCAVLAQAIAASAEPAEELFVTALEAAGLDAARPYLMPDASHDYAPFA